MECKFDPKAFQGDPRVEFELVPRDDHFVCSLCSHKIEKSQSTVIQLKSAHIRKLKHQEEMKKRLGLYEEKRVKQKHISSFFRPKPKAFELELDSIE